MIRILRYWNQTQKAMHSHNFHFLSLLKENWKIIMIHFVYPQNNWHISHPKKRRENWYECSYYFILKQKMKVVDCISGERIFIFIWMLCIVQCNTLHYHLPAAIFDASQTLAMKFNTQTHKSTIFHYPEATHISCYCIVWLYILQSFFR